MNVMTLIGIGALIGTLGAGQVYDRFGNKATITANLILLTAAIIVIIAFAQV